MGNYSNDTPLYELSGIGKARAEKYQKLGVTTLGELLAFFPRAYERRSDILPVSQADTASQRGYILTVGTRVSTAKIRVGLTLSKFRAFDETGTCEIVFFNSPYVKDVFHEGSVFRFYGKATVSRGRVQLTNPKYEPYIEGAPLPDLVPIYHSTEGISSKMTAKLVASVINGVAAKIPDPLPEDVRLRHSLPTLPYALRGVHLPESEEMLNRSLSRIAFDELLSFALGIALAGESKKRGDGIRFDKISLLPFIKKLKYELTCSQKSVINDVYKDTVLGHNGKISPMSRIVVGDVGSGKTVCAEAAMYIAARSGYQSAFMAPTEILAAQHYKEARELLGSFGIRTELLVGSLKESEKKRIRTAVELGECDVVIGTHALISGKLSFARLGLIITDEQHRFGARQRAVLKEKTKKAHMLVMSATPIPRTLALAIYGDLDVSRITELPRGRQRVDTFVVDESYRDRLNKFIEKQVAVGGQCYIVCPTIEHTDEEDCELLVPSSVGKDAMSMTSSLELKSAVEYTEELRAALPALSIECMHGKLKSSEKDAIMSRFAKGECKVLVSTTVIEVGVNVPNATLMVVENAERFGLSQLHQLRGRVGRGSRKSYCVLVSDSKSEKSRERLEVMRTTYDGYAIAEQDLMLRGPGDFFSSNSGDNIRQSGGFEFNAVKFLSDTELVDSAFKEAKAIAKEDPTLALPEHAELKKSLQKHLLSSSSLIS